MDAFPESCVIRQLIVSPSQIALLRFIMEAYEGICVVSTIDPALGLVQLNIAPGCEEDIDRILDYEKDQLQLRAINPDPLTAAPHQS